MKKTIAAALLLAASYFVASAQESNTAFFLGNYVYSYKTNPAAPITGDDFTHFAVGVGNMSVSAPTNLSYSKLVFPVGGDLRWFFDDQVSADTFLSGLNPEYNWAAPSANINLITVGRQKNGSRWNVELNLRSQSYLGVHYDAFSAIKSALGELAKEPDQRVWNMGFNNPLSFNTSEYLELAVGYGRKIGDMVTVGARIKALAGIAGANVVIDKVTTDPEPGTDHILVSSSANVNVATPLVNLATKSASGNSVYDLESVGFGKPGISGFGAAADLGITVEPVEGLSLGFSALDLGVMHWNYNIAGGFDITRHYFAKADEALDIIEEKEAFSSNVMLNYDLHLTASYCLPFGLQFGLIGTLQPYLKEVRFGVGYTPVKYVSFAVSAAYNNCGFDLGAALSLRFPGVNLFVALDKIPFAVNSYMIPLESGITNATAGLAIAF